MKMEKIDDKTVKVTLSLKDMADYDLTYEQMDYSDPETRRALMEIVKKIQRRTRLDLTSSKLFIEAYPSPDGGAVLYINFIELETFEQSIPKNQKSFDTPLVFEIADIDLVTDICNRLFQEYNHLIINSSLYHCEEIYYLFLYTYCRMEEKIIAILEEYGDYLGKGAIPAALVREHSTEIIGENALETIVKYIG